MVVPVGGSDLFGGRPVPERFESWSYGIAPSDVRGLRPNDMADLAVKLLDADARHAQAKRQGVL